MTNKVDPDYVKLTREDALELRLMLDWVKANASVRYVRVDYECRPSRKSHYEREESMQIERELRRGVEALERLIGNVK